MFVWAMRDKGSEWMAMDRFLKAGQLPFTPLIEAVCEPMMYKGKNPIDVIASLGKKLAPLTDSGRVWVDLGNLLFQYSPNDVAELHGVLRGSVGLAVHRVTPVVRTSSPGAIVEAAFEWARDEDSGICVRVDGVSRLAESAARVTEIVDAFGRDLSDVDLIFDAQDLPRAISHDALGDAFPIYKAARNWVALGGTFPGSITHMDPDLYEHRWERAEWTTWRDGATQMSTARLPMYGDYATQPPNYSPSQQFRGSPSVRYTLGEEYVVLRGRRNGEKGQYIGHARYLREQAYYREIIATPGDTYVETIAARTDREGSATTWRVASLERHLHVVAAQVARLSPVATRAL